jgi:3-hydroxybutyryl-CoA dehydrogenase
MNCKEILVVGAGTMGSGIAQVCAQSGLYVTLCDISEDMLQKAMKSISWSTAKLIEKDRVKGTLDEIIARISPTTEYAPAAKADLVIEAVFEDLELKRAIFSKLDMIARSRTVFATNTSAIPISELAACTTRPDRVLGLHFFNPVPMMAAVEVIRGMFTSDEVSAMGREFVSSLGKEPVMVNKDVPGFLINRINYPAAIEAMRLVEDGVGTVEDIDKGLRLASGRKMGIFETGDLVGLDVTCGALMAIYEETKDLRWYPPAILRRKVKAGHLGRKTGKGWYEYNADGTRKDVES